jgi:hypothetical protein
LDDGFKILVFDVIAGKLQFGFQGNTVCQTSFKAFVHRIAGSVDIIIEEFEDETVSRIGDREVFGECAVKAFIVAALGVGVDLEKLPERFQLNVQKVRIFNRSC